MRSVGIFVRAPAINSTLCLAPELNNMVYNMLIDIRKTKKEGTYMLKGSSLPFPKHEPWAASLEKIRKIRLAKGSPTIPALVKKKVDRAYDAIMTRGEGGDCRDAMTTQLLLTCPRCNGVKNAARCTLFSTRAQALSCDKCHTSTMSSLWHCSHKNCWLLCPFHREAGFRCACGRKTRHAKHSLAFKETSFMAKVKRLTRIGQLGQLKADVSNSISVAHMPKNKQNDKQKEDAQTTTTKSGGM